MFTNRLISHALRISIATIKRHHKQLLECGYLKVVKRNKQQGYTYAIVSYEEYQQLRARIETVLDEQLNQLRSAQSESEPPKQQKTSKKPSVAQS